MFKELLAAEFAPYGPLTEDQLDQLEGHFKGLNVWNTRLNLTRITTLHDVVRFHYCESLFLARFLPSGSHRIADVGSGAGFPGIPTAILRPECEITLIEAHQRKAVFLKEASRRLTNVRVVPKRAEDVAERFDWVVSRAVSPKDVLRLRLSNSFALLIGEEVAQLLDGDICRVPWGDRRVVFHVKQAD